MSVYVKENPDYFMQALDSVIQQSLQPDEIVIVKDGGLTEELETVIEKAKERYPNIVTYQFENNVQLGRALAKGLELCKYELVARMDTDDIACSNRLALQYDFMQVHPEISVCGGWMEEFNDENSYGKVKTMPGSSEELRAFARYRNPLNHMTVMMRKEDVLKCGNYIHFPLLEDYELWCRVLSNGYEIANLQEVLVKARVSENIYDRRGGYPYFKQYVVLRRKQKEEGITTGLECCIGIVLSFAMTMMPSFMRKLVYQKVLRK